MRVNEAAELAQYAIYRVGWSHAPRLVRPLEEIGHALRNRRIEHRRYGSAQDGLTVDVVGWDAVFAGYVGRLVREAAKGPVIETRLESTCSRDIEKVASASTADVCFAELPDWRTARLAERGWFVLPKRVSLVESLRAEDNAHARRVRRAVQALGLAARFSRRDADLDRFYERFYLPMVAARHGDLGQPTAPTVLRWALRSGWLVQVLHRGEWVAGAVVSPDPMRPIALQVLVVGVLDGDYAGVPEPARSAPILFARDLARAQGFVECDHLVSRPFLRDGLLSRKRRWGARVLDIRQRRDRVVLSAAGAAAARFLGTHPFIALSNNRLVGVDWGARSSARDWSVDGLDRLHRGPTLLAPAPSSLARTLAGRTRPANPW